MPVDFIPDEEVDELEESPDDSEMPVALETYLVKEDEIVVEVGFVFVK